MREIQKKLANEGMEGDKAENRTREGEETKQHEKETMTEIKKGVRE